MRILIYLQLFAMSHGFFSEVAIRLCSDLILSVINSAVNAALHHGEVFSDHKIQQIVDKLAIIPLCPNKILFLNNENHQMINMILASIENAIRLRKNLPFLLLHGHAGTGKTELAHVIMYFIYKLMKHFPRKTVFFKITGAEFARWDQRTALSVLRKIIMDDPYSDQLVVVFIDEADTCFANRDKLQGEQSVNRLLAVNEFLSHSSGGRKNLIMIFSTNRDNDMDPQFLRRIRYSLELSLPNLETLLELLHFLIKKEKEEYPEVFVFKDVLFDYKPGDCLPGYSSQETYDLYRANQAFLYELCEMSLGVSQSILTNAVEQAFLWAQSSHQMLTRELLERVIYEAVTNRFIVYAKEDPKLISHLKSQKKRKGFITMMQQLHPWYFFSAATNMHPAKYVSNCLWKAQWHAVCFSQALKYIIKAYRLVQFPEQQRKILNLINYLGIQGIDFSAEILDIIAEMGTIPISWNISPCSVEYSEIDIKG